MAAPRSLNSSAPWNPWNPWNRSSSADVPADGPPALRAVISAVYSVVCAAGLLGNLVVFLLMKARLRRGKRSSVSLFILNLAVTDFQFVLTLPFWAADVALDFSWPFGGAMCKLVLTLTVMNMYASAFFLTAMSVSRYCSVAAGLEARGRARCPVRWVIGALWLCALAAALPTALFSTARSVAGVRLCLMGFPNSKPWLLLHQLQKVLVGFVLPMLIVTVCYLLLLRFVRLRGMKARRPRRGARVTRSVTIVVLSFFLCWMPNHAVTVWGVLVELDAVRWDRAYYLVHTYVHPLSVCLAHTNSCLNPVLYCLMRREFRRRLRAVLRKLCAPLRPRPEPDDTQAAVPLQHLDTVFTEQGDTDAFRA